MDVAINLAAVAVATVDPGGIKCPVVAIPAVKDIAVVEECMAMTTIPSQGLRV